MKTLQFRLMATLAIATLAGSSLMPAMASPRDKAASAPASAGQEKTPFADLEPHVGERIAVETTFGTRRVGVLTAWTSVSINMQLGEDSGSIELTIPADTVRSVRVIGPVIPATETEGGSAKKN